MRCYDLLSLDCGAWLFTLWLLFACYRFWFCWLVCLYVFCLYKLLFYGVLRLYYLLLVGLVGCWLIVLIYFYWVIIMWVFGFFWCLYVGLGFKLVLMLFSIVVCFRVCGCLLIVFSFVFGVIVLLRFIHILLLDLCTDDLWFRLFCVCFLVECWLCSYVCVACWVCEFWIYFECGLVCLGFVYRYLL